MTSDAAGRATPLFVANLSALDDASWQGWCRARLGSDWAELAAQGPDDPALAGAAGPLLVIYDPLESALTAAMAAGAAPSARLADWDAAARRLLDLWRANRRGVFLAAADALVADPAGLARTLGGWLGRDLSATAAPSDPVLPDPVHPDPARAALAALPRLATPALRRLCDELAVAGLAGPAPDPAAMLDAAAQALAAPRPDAGSEDSARLVALLEEERGLLRDELAALQETLEEEYRARADRTAWEMRQAALETEILRLTGQIAARDQRLVALAEDQRRLTLDLAAREATLAALYASTSWRVAAPLRALRRAMTPQGGNG